MRLDQKRYKQLCFKYESLNDAKDVANTLKIKFSNLEINEAMRIIDKTLGKFNGKNISPGITEENIQSRLRGLLLMALSNRYGYMVLATGNKSEYAVGYSTLYGDMCGGSYQRCLENRCF